MKKYAVQDLNRNFKTSHTSSIEKMLIFLQALKKKQKLTISGIITNDIIIQLSFQSQRAYLQYILIYKFGKSNIKKMQPEHEIKANILIEVQNTAMHRFVSKEKSLFTSGTCKVAKIENPNQNVVYFINLNSFYYTLNRSVIFARLEYSDTVSYLFPHFDNGLSSITIIKKDQVVHNFEEIISNAAVLVTFDQAIKNTDFKARVNEHCPGIEKEPILVADKIKATIREAGKIIGIGFKALGNFLAGGVQTVGEYIGNKVEQPQQKTEVAPETKQKWQNLKKGTSNALNVSKDLYTKYLSPIVSVGVEYGKQVVTKIETSDNPTIKYARELAQTSGEAVGTAFKGLAEGSTKVGTELGSQSRKIVNKKYGEDYVHTFLPEDEKKSQTKEQTVGQNTVTIAQKQNDSQQKLYPELGEIKEQKKQ